MIIDSCRLEMIAFHISNICGARCPYCYTKDSIVSESVEVDTEHGLNIIECIAKAKVREILFVGGDPVVHPSFSTFIREAKHAGLVVSVLSNSWSLRPHSSFGEQLSFIDNCEATVLAPTAAAHNAITGQPHSYEKLVQNLQMIVAHGKTVGLCVNAMPQTLSHIFDTVRKVLESNILLRGVTVQRIIPSGSAKGNSKFSLSYSDVDTLMDQVDLIYRELGIRVNFEDPVPYCAVQERHRHYLHRCEWGFTKGAVNAKGLITRCGADSCYRLGSVFDGSLQEIWRTNPILVSFRSKKYLPSKCRVCSFLDGCGGGCSLSADTSSDHGLDAIYLQLMEADDGGFENIRAKK